MTDLVDAIRAIEPELIAIRHDLHRHREMGFEETHTAALVAERLRAWGLDVTEGIARTGVVASRKSPGATTTRPTRHRRPWRRGRASGDRRDPASNAA